MIPTALRRLPRSAIAPGLDVDGGDKRVRRARSVLVLAELPATVRARMRNRGADLSDVENVAAAVAMLAERDFDAAIVDMRAPGGGTGLVKCLKAGVGSTDAMTHLIATELARLEASPEETVTEENIGELLSENLNRVAAARVAAGVEHHVILEQRARRRHRLTPFFLVMEGEQQYAVVVEPPEHSYLEDGKGLSLADAVMCLDVGRLLLRGPALA